MSGGVTIRAAEGCADESNVLWDSVWQPERGYADWALATGEPNNRGGLQATSALETAATLCLFTDRRVDPAHPLAYLADGDNRGWWGDGVDVRGDLGEEPLGSLLWLLERAPMTIAGFSVGYWAEQFALEALAPLQSQGAVVRIEAAAEVNEIDGRLELTVRMFGRDGLAAYDRRFDVLWNRVAR